VTDPFTEWRDGTPYWLRDVYPQMAEVNLRLIQKMYNLHRGAPPAKMAPNPLARTWHDV
jgi:hypothetical protein